MRYPLDVAKTRRVRLIMGNTVGANPVDMGLVALDDGDFISNRRG